jgi:Ankyrin repeats (many copies)
VCDACYDKLRQPSSSNSRAAAPVRQENKRPAQEEQSHATMFFSSSSSGPTFFSSSSASSQSTASKQYDMKGNLNEQCRDAVKNKDRAGVKQLLAAGAKATYVDRTGNSLLHLAALFNCFEIAEMLVAGGASLNLKNPSGETPLDIAPPSMAHRLKNVK